MGLHFKNCPRENHCRPHQIKQIMQACLVNKKVWHFMQHFKKRVCHYPGLVVKQPTT